MAASRRQDLKSVCRKESQRTSCKHGGKDVFYSKNKSFTSNASRIKCLIGNNKVTKRRREPTLEYIALLPWFSQLRLTQLDFPISRNPTDTDADNEFTVLIDQLHCHTQIPANVDVEMYVSCDDDAHIAATPTDEHLLLCEDDINEEEEIQERVEPSDAISAVQVLKQFLVEADSISPDFLSTLAEIEFFVESCHFQSS